MILPPWIVSFLINTVFVYVVKAIEKWGEKIDWELVKKDVRERVAKLIPGTLFDGFVTKITDAIIDKLALALDTPEKLKPILDSLVNGNFALAIKLVKDLFLGETLAHEETEAKLAAACKELASDKEIA